MSERKVLQKYYPPDFDPNKVRRGRTGGGKSKTVRLMAPFSMRCNTCGEYIYRGKKFNARKETVNDDNYYGIEIFRFYIKCSRCSAEITFKTDPKNSDYAAEHGAQRNFEPWRDHEDRPPSPDPDAEAEEEPEVDPMKALEKRMMESQREMEVLDALQDIRTRNARLERVDTDTVLQTRDDAKRRAEEDAPPPEKETHEEDEELVRKYFRRETKDGVSTVVLTAPDGTEPPDAASLLDEQTRAHLQSLIAKPASSEGAKPPLKRRRGPNALGIVRKS